MRTQWDVSASTGNRRFAPGQVRLSAMNEAQASPSAGIQPLPDVQDIPSSSCAICMSEQLQQPAKIRACGHCFWLVHLSPACQLLADSSTKQHEHVLLADCSLQCIRQWSRSSPEPRCPLCNGSFQVLVHDGTEEVRSDQASCNQSLLRPTVFLTDSCLPVQELPLSSQQRARVEGMNLLQSCQ